MGLIINPHRFGGGGGTTITVKLYGETISAIADTVNFKGSTVVAADAGGGETTVTVAV